MSTANIARNAYERYLPNARGAPAIVIEAAYLDLRDPLALDRIVHLRDALKLVEMLRARWPELGPRLLLAAFVNDITIGTRLCGIESCGDGLIDAGREAMIRDILHSEFIRCGQDPNMVRTFSMRNTRNRATKSIRRALKRGSRDGIGIIEDAPGDFVTDVFADNGTRRILLASHRHGKPTYLPRCTAIMAQHYFDLYQYANSQARDLTDIWIFDFNRFTEAARVAAGAETSFVLHDWPPAISVHVANCIYYPVTSRQSRVQITEGP